MHAIPMNFQTIQKVCLGVGLVGLVVSCLMTYKFGATMSQLHAVMLCLGTIIAAFIFPAKKFIHDMGFLKIAKNVGRVGVFFICLELFAHLGYTIGMRELSISEAGTQTVAYKIRQESVASEVANMDMWRKQLADLKARNKAHSEKNQGWLVSVDPVAMQSQLEAIDQQIANEAKRVRCGDKCEKLKTQKGQLASLIGNIKEENDLTTRIEATQRILDGKAEKAATIKSGFSSSKAQTDFFGKMWTLISSGDGTAAMNPDEVTTTVSGWIIGLFIAIGATALPTTAFYLAFFGVGVAAVAASKIDASRLTAIDAKMPGETKYTLKMEDMSDDIRDMLRGIKDTIATSGLKTA